MNYIIVSSFIVSNYYNNQKIIGDRVRVIKSINVKRSEEHKNNNIINDSNNHYESDWIVHLHPGNHPYSLEEYVTLLLIQNEYYFNCTFYYYDCPGNYY